jgi:hypothetical protein
MTLIGVPAFTMIAIVWFGVQAEAQTPCPELARLRNAATEAWMAHGVSSTVITGGMAFCT